jgi:type VI secretion system protein ImpB
VVESVGPTLELSVKDKLGDDPDADVDLTLDFKSMADFHPDNIVRSFPALGKLMELRDALRALKGPLGNVSQFRRHLGDIVKDEKARAALLKELNVSTADKASAKAKK